MKHHLERINNEQFYTNPEIALKLINYLKAHFGGSFDSFNLIVEPSAGTGSFSLNLPKYKTLAMDIEPKHKDIKKKDFLLFNSFHIQNKYNPKSVLCIGNPPFGHNSSLAKQFIKKCSEFSNHIAFILPKSFRSPSYMKSIPINFHKVLDIVLPTDIFIYPNSVGNPKKLQTVFMYFKWQDTPRRNPQTYKPNNNWSYVLKSDPGDIERNADFRVVRGAGKVGKCYIRDDPDYKVTGSSYTDYYISLKKSHKRKLRSICNQIDNHKFVYNNISQTLRTLNRDQLTRYLNQIIQ
jgi:predicted RNA methylase